MRPWKSCKPSELPKYTPAPVLAFFFSCQTRWRLLRGVHSRSTRRDLRGLRFRSERRATTGGPWCARTSRAASVRSRPRPRTSTQCRRSCVYAKRLRRPSACRLAPRAPGRRGPPPPSSRRRGDDAGGADLGVGVPSKGRERGRGGSRRGGREVRFFRFPRRQVAPRAPRLTRRRRGGAAASRASVFEGGEGGVGGGGPGGCRVGSTTLHRPVFGGREGGPRRARGGVARGAVALRAAASPSARGRARCRASRSGWRPRARPRASRRASRAAAATP